MAKNPIYIFLHISKCSGSTIRKHIRNNFKKSEILYLYGSNSTCGRLYKNPEEYINKLDKQSKENIKIIIGHRVTYDLKDLFPERDVRFLTFLRDPVDRIISLYNYHKMLNDGWIIPVKRNRVADIVGEKTNFSDFKYFIENIPNGGGLYDFLKKRLVGKKKHQDNNACAELKQILSSLSHFYFVGITSNSNDYLYVYNKLKVKRYYGNRNISCKYITRDGRPQELVESILKQFPYDQAIYNHAVTLNKRYLQNCGSDYMRRVEETSLARKKYLNKKSSKIKEWITEIPRYLSRGARPFSK